MNNIKKQPTFPTLQEFRDRLPDDMTLEITIVTGTHFGCKPSFLLCHKEWGPLVEGSTLAFVMVDMAKKLGTLWMESHYPLDVYPGSW
jgi:hypothetical protein